MIDALNEQRLFTLEEYDLMVEAGVFDEDERLELIEGRIVQMSPRGTGHSYALSMIQRFLVALVVARRAEIRVQDPVRLPPLGEPEPDLALLRWRDEGYREHPQAGDILLLVEVADTSVRYDRQVKLPLYAKSGIQEVWIVDLPARVIDVFRQPVAAEARYASVATRRAGDTISPAAFPDVSVAVGDLL